MEKPAESDKETPTEGDKETQPERDKEQLMPDTNNNSVKTTEGRWRHPALQDVTDSTTSAEVIFIDLILTLHHKVTTVNEDKYFTITTKSLKFM